MYDFMTACQYDKSNIQSDMEKIPLYYYKMYVDFFLQNPNDQSYNLLLFVFPE